MTPPQPDAVDRESDPRRSEEIAPASATRAVPWLPPSWSARRARGVVVSALMLGTLLLFAGVAGHGFVEYDDNRYVTENPVVQGGLTWAGLVWAFTTLHASNWHPLTWLSHMLDVQLFGLAAGAHHVVNVLLHAVDAALVFLVLARMTGAPGRSALVAALFAVHPTHVESVAWVAERKDVLSTLFGLLALWAWARWTERPSRRRYAAVVLCFAASLLAKPMWVTLPFLLLLLDWWPLGRVAGGPPAAVEGGAAPRGWAALVREKGPLFALAAASSAVTVLAQHRGGSVTGLELGVGARLGNAAVSYLRYVEKTVWPSSLSIFYPHPRDGLPAWAMIAAGAVLLAVTALALARARRAPWLAVGWCAFLGTLVPVIGLVQVGTQAMADRYTYLPTLGLFVAAAWGAHRVAGSWRGGAPLAAVAGLVLALLSAVTARQLSHWRTHEQLFRHAVTVAPENAHAHAVLSKELRRQRRTEEGLLHAREAVRLDPTDVRYWNNLAVATRELGLTVEARDALDRALQLDPLDPGAWMNLGLLAQDAGDLPAAEAAFREATRVGAGIAEPFFRLGLLEARDGRLEDAIRDYREAVRLAPHHFGAWTNLAVAYQTVGLAAEADEAFHAAVRAAPESPIARRNLAVYLARTGRLVEAGAALRDALRLTPGDPELLRQLGTIQVATGQRAEAMLTAAQLDALAPAFAAEIRARLAEGP
jgi:Flp pilus assembly protein TadD